MDDLPRADLRRSKLERSAAKFNLSTRQRQIAVEISLGRRNREIAESLKVTEKTIKFHATEIYKRLKVRTRMELMILLEHGPLGTLPEGEH